MSDANDRKIGSLQAAIFAQNAIQVSLITALRRKGLLNRDETNELLDDALMTLEQLQMKLPKSEQWVVEIARSHVEATLPRLKP